MSKEAERSRPRRSDAEANTTRICEAALDLLGRGENPSMAQIAERAGLSRQTVHNHFPTRRTLYRTLRDALISEAAARLDDEALPDDPAAALREWLSRAWQLLDAYPAMLNPSLFADSDSAGDTMEEHAPIVGGLRRILGDAAKCGLLTEPGGIDWLVAAVIALGHAAGQEVASGRLTRIEAGAAFREGALRLCLISHD